jgi:signal transduction protein with GAF and PtsI domain
MSNVEDLGARLRELRNRREGLYQGDQSQRAGKLLEFYTRIMTKVTDSERCSVFINDPTHDRVWLKAGTGLREADIEVPREGSVVGQVIASGEPITVSDMQMKSGAHKETDQKTGFVTRNILCVPIKSAERREVTGAFQILNKRGGDFSEDDKSLALELASHLQLEVDSIYLDQEIFGLSEGLQSAAVRSNRMMFVSLGVAVVLFVGAMMMVGMR